MKWISFPSVTFGAWESDYSLFEALYFVSFLTFWFPVMGWFEVSEFRWSYVVEIDI
jgi:hypothetical protein